MVSAHPRLIVLEKKSFAIWTQKEIDMPLWGSGSSLRNSQTVDFDTLSTAKLTFTVNSNTFSFWATLYLNGSKIKDFDWRLAGGTKTGTVDVQNLLVKGSNIFLFQAQKVSWIMWGTINVTVNLEVEGKNVGVTPPSPLDNLPGWLSNPYVLGGIGLGAVGLIVLMVRPKPQTVYVRNGGSKS